MPNSLFWGIGKGVSVGGVVQQQPAFSQGFSAWGVQGSRGLWTRCFAAAVPPRGVSTSTQSTLTIALAFISP